jgi:ribose 5-phosphate isomerase B
MKIYAGSDHAGLSLKNILIAHLEKKGYQVEDLGTYTADSCDYPDYAHKVAEKVLEDTASKGLLVCGSGIGISIAANRHPGIRAALVHCSLEAELSRKHNNANVIVMGGRIIGEELAKDALDKFLTTEFEGGRHEKRVNKIEINK